MYGTRDGGLPTKLHPRRIHFPDAHAAGGQHGDGYRACINLDDLDTFRSAALEMAASDFHGAEKRVDRGRAKRGRFFPLDVNGHRGPS